MAKSTTTTKKVVIAGAILLLLGIGIYFYSKSRKKDEKKTLQDVFDNLVFETGKDVIKPESFSYLDKLSEVLVAEPNWKLKIVGHTDSVGNEIYNLDLSKRRANAVKLYLVSKSVPESNITADGKGESMPIANNTTAEGRSKNRRVEFVIVKPDNATINTTK